MYKFKSAEEAVRITLKLWQYLARYPQKGKEDWPGWQKYGWMYSGCPLCAFDNQANPVGVLLCLDCPLRDMWVTGLLSIDHTEGRRYCYHSKSPYSKWVDAWEIGAFPAERKYAKQIVNLLKKWLKEQGCS